MQLIENVDFACLAFLCIPNKWAENQLTPLQLKILFCLRLCPDGLNMEQCSQLLGFKWRSNHKILTNLKPLEDRGFIHRSSKQLVRTTYIYITKSGNKACSEYVSVLHEQYNRIMDVERGQTVTAWPLS